LMRQSDGQGEKQVSELKRELRDKALLLANLEVIIEDYRREKRRLLEEVMALRERIWDLSGQGDSDEESGPQDE
jgi:hypothetical protein